MSEEIYELQQEYLVPDHARQEYLLEEAMRTDAAINGLQNCKISDVVHSLVHLQPELAKVFHEELSYWIAKDAL